MTDRELIRWVRRIVRKQELRDLAVRIEKMGVEIAAIVAETDNMLSGKQENTK